MYNGKFLNRKKLASYIFSDEVLLEKTNAIIHPEVARTFFRWVEKRKRQPIVAIEAALLIEAKFHHLVDKTITVYAPHETRINRVIQRDGLERSAILARMQQQLSDEEKMRLSDFVIYNEGNRSLIAQVEEMLVTFKRKLP